MTRERIEFGGGEGRGTTVADIYVRVSVSVSVLATSAGEKQRS